MKIKLIIIIAASIALATFLQCNFPNRDNFPIQSGYVNDFENLFTIEEVEELTSIIEAHEKETSNEIAVVSIKTYEPYETLFKYSLDLSNHWGVGKSEKKNGILIVFGKEIRQIRIMTGYGLEDKLKDNEAKLIIDKVIIPEFKNDQYYEGIKKGVLQIIKEIK